MSDHAVTLVDEPRGTVAAYADGERIAAVWGPAVDNGEWFLAIQGEEPRRVATREQAISLLPARWSWPATPDTTGGREHG